MQLSLLLSNFNFFLLQLAPSNNIIDRWENWISAEIHNRRMLLASDYFYLRYVYNQYHRRYDAMHLSEYISDILPFSVALNRANPAQLNTAVNKLYVSKQVSSF